MAGFEYVEILPIEHDTTAYRKVSSDFVSTQKAFGKDFLVIQPEAFSLITSEAMFDINHFFRRSHLEQLALILKDPEASANDRFVAFELLKNANISSGGVLPSCQDTGTAIVIGKKGQCVYVEQDEAKYIALGIYERYQKSNLRYSQLAPLSMYEEVNTKTNLPAQIELFAQPGNEYHFLFIAKGGGSANKTFFFQQTRALLNPEAMLAFLDLKMKTLGTSACPPYHLAIVIGGMSAEYNLKVAKLASTRFLDTLPTQGSATGRAFRDKQMEAQILSLARKNGIGAQFGGKYFCHDVRVVRLPRHNASLPIGIAVSCSADRQVLGKITAEGIFLEDLERDPAQFLPVELDAEQTAVSIHLNQPMAQIVKVLSQYPIKTRVNLTGTLVVARDIAHARIKKQMDTTGQCPEYFKKYCIYYAGPAKTPAGLPSGSFGPTTAGRMDSYIEQLHAMGASLVTLAKGNRSQKVTDSCKKHGAFYLGSIGGTAAALAQNSIRKIEVLDFEELGLEAVWKIEVENFPAFIVVDDKGNNFFEELSAIE
jgi:fumarate hydratase class I